MKYAINGYIISVKGKCLFDDVGGRHEKELGQIQII